MSAIRTIVRLRVIIAENCEEQKENKDEEEFCFSI